MAQIDIKNLIHEYKEFDENENVTGVVRAVNDVTLDVEEGSFIVVLGHNGSGKSTLLKHINALLMPTTGTVEVNGRDTTTTEEIWEIRRDAGMIFQNPDNQIIGTTVEEDVAFGPENIGVPQGELADRVNDALQRVGMMAYMKQSPNRLSGGQKQRVGIAGVLAMKPRCILMDEPTAMLDPVGRREVLETIHELNQREGITIVLVTHYMEEATHADRVIIMDEGRIVMDGTPREIFSQEEQLKAFHMTVPQVTELSYELKRAGLPIPSGILTVDELTEALWKLH